MDSHSQSLLFVNGTWFLYGELYGNVTGPAQGWHTNPKIGLYTSPDLENWTFRGEVLESNTTQWVPCVIYDASRGRFVMWYGEGYWGIATSEDGYRFELVAQNVRSRIFEARTDGNALLVDEDGSGYVVFADYVPGDSKLNHLVSIERLTADYLNTTHENVTGFFPDGFVEGAVVWKRQGRYYVAYGECCCACRWGSGFVVYSAEAITGPWVRQGNDLNCNASMPVCSPFHEPIPAQGFQVQPIQTTNGTAFLWTANRWLQGPNNNPNCTNLCNSSPECTLQGQPEYRVGKDPTYWGILEFDQQGNVLPFKFVDSFTIDLPE